MKTQLLIAILILSLSSSSKANVDCIWVSNKAGITIRYVAPCNFENQKLIDSLLNKVVGSLNRQDTSLKVLLLINEEQLSFPGRNHTHFTSIGFDVLNLMQHDSIFNYYQSKTIASQEANYGLNKYESKKEPLDINFGNKINEKLTGIKIIYNKYDHFEDSDWADLEKLIFYAAQNHEIIKNTQTRDTVRYNANGWYVSLLTIDTFAINKIIGRQTQTLESIVTSQKKGLKENPWIWWFLGFLIIAAVAFTYRRHSR